MNLLEWIQAHPVWFATILTVGSIVASAIVVPIQVTRMAPDYFLEERDPDNKLQSNHPIARILGLTIKNLLGGLLVLVGILLSLPGIPGQGLLTILIGLMIMDFPGKRKLELKLIRFGPVTKAVNWIRQQRGKPELKLPASPFHSSLPNQSDS